MSTLAFDLSIGNGLSMRSVVRTSTKPASESTMQLEDPVGDFVELLDGEKRGYVTKIVDDDHVVVALYEA